MVLLLDRKDLFFRRTVVATYRHVDGTLHTGEQEQLINEIISITAVERRKHWIGEIMKISGRFGADSARIEDELDSELSKDGTSALFDHLRMCGSIPENYGHDSSEEKLYSKYTDALLASVFRHIGLTSIVITERADTADVEAVGQAYSLVADAKVFRLSRTAKNQKDFKIDAMHGWKRGKPHAMVVCPIYQLPVRTSQLYNQAITRNVCVFTYAHLAVLVSFCDYAGREEAQKLLLKVLRSAETLNPTKDSIAYWKSINSTMLEFDDNVGQMWQTEKIATSESIALAKEEALIVIARQREQIMRMSRAEAIVQLINDRKIDSREKVIKSVSDAGIFSIA